MKSKVCIVLNGCLGRMGKEIAKIVLDHSEMELLFCREYQGHPDTGKDVGDILGMGHRACTVNAQLDFARIKNQEASVVIDFSTPQSTIALLQQFHQQQVPAAFVIGTTGFSESELHQIGEFASQRAILVSPNMSVGVNFLFYLAKIATQALGGEYDIEIIEAHHRLKKDSPSGTAKQLGQIVADAMHVSYDDAVTHGRSGLVGQRKKGEIGMHAVRGGTIIGDHTVLFAGDADVVEIRHHAQSRSIFAQGAVRVAQWIATKNPGFYSMNDFFSWMK
ncbi:MAG: 4-hydroxy-tetrahydrodipicolinate reductase [Chitinivibrionales bacterium]|nr:4-hydroxy-tetrahydrodipicolinate reductase [Chitinivibrionales bacterium]